MTISEACHIQESDRLDPGLALRRQAPLYLVVLIFGAFVNLLVLTGPLFALQVYDRVLSSKSVETLAALSGLMVFLFVIMGILDHARKRIAARAGERLVSALAAAICQQETTAASWRKASVPATLAQLEDLRRFFASPVLTALLDLPWLPVFLVAIGLFHPMLGLLGLLGATIILIPIVFSIFGKTRRTEAETAASWAADALSNTDTVLSLGGISKPLARWQQTHEAERLRAVRARDRQAAFASAHQTFRLILQSATVAVAAYLVIRDELTAGAIIAAAILLARALSPLDVIGQNTALIRALRLAWQNLSKQLATPCRTPTTMTAPTGAAGLAAEQLTVFPTAGRRAALRMINFNLPSGQCMGVIGPSGAGKSTLARAISGALPVAGGQLLVRGVPAGAHGRPKIGYLPQHPNLLTGTIAQNIAGFAPELDENHLVHCAITVGIHQNIMALPDGYDTMLGTAEGALPGALLQQIALARAIHDAPEILVLDEPANNLDAAAVRNLDALVREMRSRDTTVIICTQRPSLLDRVDKVLVLDDGTQQDFGPTAQVLQRLQARLLQPRHAKKTAKAK